MEASTSTHFDQSIVPVRLNIWKLHVLGPDDVGVLTTSTQDVWLDMYAACCSDRSVEGSECSHRPGYAGVGVIIGRVDSHAACRWLRAGIKNHLQESFTRYHEYVALNVWQRILPETYQFALMLWFASAETTSRVKLCGELSVNNGTNGVTSMK